MSDVGDAHECRFNVWPRFFGGGKRDWVIRCRCGRVPLKGSESEAQAIAGMSEVQRMRMLRFGMEHQAVQGEMKLDG